MNIEEAIDKGFLNIEEEQASSVIDDLFDTEDAQTRLEQGIELMRTFVPDEKIPYAARGIGRIISDCRRKGWFVNGTRGRLSFHAARQRRECRISYVSGPFFSEHRR